MLGFDHVANRKFGEFHERLRLAVRRRSRNAIADGVHENHKVSAGVDDISRPCELQQVFRLATQPSGPKNGVRLFRIELAEGAIAKAEILNDAAAPQFERPKLRKLLRAVSLSGLRCHRRDSEQEKED